MFSRRKMLAGLGAIATTAAAGIPIDGIIRRSGATTIGSITMSGDSLFFAIGEELWRYQTDLNLWTQIDSAVNK